MDVKLRCEPAKILPMAQRYFLFNLFHHSHVRIDNHYPEECPMSMRSSRLRHHHSSTLRGRSRHNRQTALARRRRRMERNLASISTMRLTRWHGVHFHYEGNTSYYVLEQSSRGPVLEILVTTALSRLRAMAWNLGNLHFGIAGTMPTSRARDRRSQPCSNFSSREGVSPSGA